MDLAELHQLELAASLSVSLIENWLTEYKFKNWKVGQENKRRKAREIAEELNNHERWYTHGNSIHKDILEDMGLKIDDYGTEAGLREAVWKYFWSMLEYTNKRFHSFVQSREYL